MNNRFFLGLTLKEWFIIQTPTEQSNWLKGMSLLITSHNQLALTSCVARCLFGGLFFWGVINHSQLLWNASQCSGTVWSWQRWFSVSKLTFLIIYFGLPCMHTESWKRLAKNRGLRGREARMLPCAPLQPPFPVKLSVPLFEEEGRGGFPYLCLAYEFSSHRRGLLPEQADLAESHAAKLYSSWGESLLWITPCPQSGLVLISLLVCAQTEGVLLITANTFEDSLDEFQESIIIKNVLFFRLLYDGLKYKRPKHINQVVETIKDNGDLKVQLH